MTKKLYELMEEGQVIADRLGLKWSDNTLPIDLMQGTYCGLGCALLPLLPKDKVETINTNLAINMLSEVCPHIHDEVEFNGNTREIVIFVWLLNDGFPSVGGHSYTIADQIAWLKEYEG